MSENPYNPLQPTPDPTLFYGREDAIAFLQLHLSGRVTQRALVILGPYGIGKSSLLTQVPLVVDERYPSINIDLSTIELSSPVALVATLVDKTRALMSAIQASTYRLPAFPDPTDPQVDLLKWLADDFLDVVFSAIRRQRHLVIMLDNAHLLFDAIAKRHFPADFMAYLQGLLDKYDQLDLLATIDITYEEEALKTAPFNETSLHFRLTLLPASAASQLITEPVTEVYEYAPGALERVLEIAGGHPFHLQSICRLIYRRWEEARSITVIGLDDVESVYPAALDMAGETVNPLWEKLRQNEQIVLIAMLGLRKQDRPIHVNDIEEWLRTTKFSLTGLQIAAALRGLEYWGLLQSDQDGRIYFPVGIQADWLVRQIEVDKAEAKAQARQPFSITGLIAAVVVLVVIGVGIWLAGILDDDEEKRTSPESGQPTVTLVVPTATPPPPTPRPPFLFGG